VRLVRCEPAPTAKSLSQTWPDSPPVSDSYEPARVPHGHIGRGAVGSIRSWIGDSSF
jgi:hypothetical protein